MQRWPIQNTTRPAAARTAGPDDRLALGLALRVHRKALRLGSAWTRSVEVKPGAERTTAGGQGGSNRGLLRVSIYPRQGIPASFRLPGRTSRLAASRRHLPS
jgi:hypothetical protein